MPRQVELLANRIVDGGGTLDRLDELLGGAGRHQLRQRAAGVFDDRRARVAVAGLELLPAAELDVDLGLRWPYECAATFEIQPVDLPDQLVQLYQLVVPGQPDLVSQRNDDDEV